MFNKKHVYILSSVLILFVLIYFLSAFNTYIKISKTLDKKMITVLDNNISFDYKYKSYNFTYLKLFEVSLNDYNITADSVTINRSSSELEITGLFIKNVDGWVKGTLKISLQDLKDKIEFSYTTVYSKIDAKIEYGFDSYKKIYLEEKDGKIVVTNIPTINKNSMSLSTPKNLKFDFPNIYNIDVSIQDINMIGFIKMISKSHELFLRSSGVSEEVIKNKTLYVTGKNNTSLHKRIQKDLNTLISTIPKERENDLLLYGAKFMLSAAKNKKPKLNIHLRKKNNLSIDAYQIFKLSEILSVEILQSSIFNQNININIKHRRN